jgi:hypothetical protein
MIGAPSTRQWWRCSQIRELPTSAGAGNSNLSATGGSGQFEATTADCEDSQCSQETEDLSVEVACDL